MQRLNGTLLTGLDTGQGILYGLDLAQLPLKFFQIRFMTLFNSGLPADHRHAGGRFSVVEILFCMLQVLDPAEHPVLPDGQEPDLLEEKPLLVCRHSIRQAALIWFQAIKKESLKLSRCNCILILFRSGAAAVPLGIFIPWLTALFLCCTTFL